MNVPGSAPSIPAMRSFAWAPVAFLLTVAACGGSGRDAVAPRPPPGVAGPLGGEADVVITLRPRAVTSDPHFGVLTQRTLAQSSRKEPSSAPWGTWLSQVGAVEIYARTTPGEPLERARVLLVLRDVPPSPSLAQLPLAPKSKGRVRVGAFANGVEEYVEETADDPATSSFRGSMFVLPGGRTWIGGDARTSAELRASFARSLDVPAPADDGGALFTVALGRGVLEPLAGTFAALGSAVPGTVGLSRVALAVRGEGRDGVEVALRVEYDRADQADVLARLAGKKSRDELLCPTKDAACLARWRDVDVDASRDGNALTLRVRAPRSLMDDLVKKDTRL